MSKSIWYLGGSANSYDGQIGRYAVQELMRAKSKKALYFTFLDGQNTYLSPTIIDQINKSADLLIVGNGGFIQDREAYGLLYNINECNVRDITVPVVGFSIEDFTKYPNADHKMWKALDAFVNKADLFSVGFSNSLDDLEKQGIDTDRISAIPDPSIFIKPMSLWHKAFDNGFLKVGIHWDKQNFKALYDAVKNLVTHYNAKIYVIEHDAETEYNKDDKTLMRRVVQEDIMSNKACVVHREIYNELYPPSANSVPLFVDMYRQMDLIIGSCPYSAMLALGQGTPFIGIGLHSYLKYFLLDANLDHVKYVDEDMIIRSVDEIMSKSKLIKDNMTSMKEQFQYSTEWFVEQILSLDF